MIHRTLALGTELGHLRAPSAPAARPPGQEVTTPSPGIPAGPAGLPEPGDSPGQGLARGRGCLSAAAPARPVHREPLGTGRSPLTPPSGWGGPGTWVLGQSPGQREELPPGHHPGPLSPREGAPMSQVASGSEASAPVFGPSSGPRTPVTPCPWLHGHRAPPLPEARAPTLPGASQSLTCMGDLPAQAFTGSSFCLGCWAVPPHPRTFPGVPPSPPPCLPPSPHHTAC